MTGSLDFDRVIDGIPGVSVERARELAVGLARWSGFGPAPDQGVVEHFKRVILAVLAPPPQFAPSAGQWSGRWGT